MPTTDPDRDNRPLGEEECLRLLGTTGIGRVAYSQAALPAIRPVSYTLRNGAVVIPTRVGSALARAARGAVIAFEADHYDDATRTGWSVTVVGPAWVDTGGRSEDPDGCLIAVRLGIVRGWRTTLSMRATGAAEPVDEASSRT